MKETPEKSTKNRAEEPVAETKIPSPDGPVPEPDTQLTTESGSDREAPLPAVTASEDKTPLPTETVSDEEVPLPMEAGSDRDEPLPAEARPDEGVQQSPEESSPESPAVSPDPEKMPESVDDESGSSSGDFEFKPLFSARTQSILLVVLPALFLALVLFYALSGRIPRRKPSEEKIDKTPPSIMLTRDNKYFVYPGEEYEEEGYAAYDNLDGDLTKKVEVSVNGDMIRYRVSDNAGNTTVRFRRIPYADKDSAPED